jgi:hypothetical protein
MQNFPSRVDVFKVTLQSEFDFLLGSTLASRRQRESAFFSAIEDLDVTPIASTLTRSEGTIGELKMLLAATATDAMRNGMERITEGIIDRCKYMSPSERKQRPASG